jgi:hypothetical protein
VEVSNLLLGVFDAFRVLPGVVLHSIAFPLNQILQLPTEHPTIQDFFHDVLLLTIYKFWWGRRRLASSEDGIIRSGCELYNVEYRM